MIAVISLLKRLSCINMVDIIIIIIIHGGPSDLKSVLQGVLLKNYLHDTYKEKNIYNISQLNLIKFYIIK